MKSRGARGVFATWAGAHGGVWRAGLAAAALLVLSACGSPPRSPDVNGLTPRPGPAASGDPRRDGPPAQVPVDLARIPDAEPRLDPLRVGGPNKPYEVDGERYTPETTDRKMVQRGLASWYGRKFHGKPTSNGETYDMFAMTAAHRTMPLPSYAVVRNPANGREVVVRVNDRGPFHADRVIDLSYAAALRLGVLGGVTPVEVERLTHEEIRLGLWKRPDGRATVPEAVLASNGRVPANTTAGSPPNIASQAQPDPLGDWLQARGAVQGTGMGRDLGAPDPGGLPTPVEPAGIGRPGGGFWVQLGAFRQRDGAQNLRRAIEQEVAPLAPQLAIVEDRSVHRVQAGPYASREAAQAQAEQLGQLLRGALGLRPLVIERR